MNLISARFDLEAVLLHGYIIAAVMGKTGLQLPSRWASTGALGSTPREHEPASVVAGPPPNARAPLPFPMSGRDEGQPLQPGLVPDTQ